MRESNSVANFGKYYIATLIQEVLHGHFVDDTKQNTSDHENRATQVQAQLMLGTCQFELATTLRPAHPD